MEIKNGEPTAIGWSQVVKVIDDDKEAANEFFTKVAKRLARDLKTWIPAEADNGIFFDYEGRKPQATITIGWDEDRYHSGFRNREHDEEDLERMEAEWKEQHKDEDDEELPFM